MMTTCGVAIVCVHARVCHQSSVSYASLHLDCMQLRVCLWCCVCWICRFWALWASASPLVARSYTIFGPHSKTWSSGIYSQSPSNGGFRSAMYMIGGPGKTSCFAYIQCMPKAFEAASWLCLAPNLSILDSTGILSLSVSMLFGAFHE